MKLEGSGLSQRIVDIAELEPFMPEEGDMVKLLVPGEVEEPGQVNTYLWVDTVIQGPASCKNIVAGEVIIYFDIYPSPNLKIFPLGGNNKYKTFLFDSTVSKSKKTCYNNNILSLKLIKLINIRFKGTVVLILHDLYLKRPITHFRILPLNLIM